MERFSVLEGLYYPVAPFGLPGFLDENTKKTSRSVPGAERHIRPLKGLNATHAGERGIIVFRKMFDLSKAASN